MLRFCCHHRKTTELATARDGDITKLIMVLREHPILVLTGDRLHLKPFPFTNSFVPLDNHREEGIISALQIKSEKSNSLAQGHTSNCKLGQDLNPELLTS